MAKNTCVSGLLLLTYLFCTSMVLAEEVERVRAKSGGVKKDGVIDKDDADESTAESVVSLADGKIRIVTKTFLPPEGAKFRPFPGSPTTYVDILTNPGDLPVDRLKKTANEVKIRAVFLEPTNAGQFPLQVEGNLSFLGNGGGGKKGESSHWSVKIDSLKVALLIGADNVDDISTADDWVGVNGHQIGNFIKVTSTPNTTVTVTLDNKVDGKGKITIKPKTLNIAIGTSGVGSASFVITGNARSDGVGNITVEATVNGTVVATETLTVLQTIMYAENRGRDPIPVNPAVVNSFEHAKPINGNLLGVVRRASNTDGDAFTFPTPLEKIAPSVIEVLWAREVGGKLTQELSAAPSQTGLSIAPDPTDLLTERKTNFRMRDTTFPSNQEPPATAKKGTTVTYFFGHPTSQTNIVPAIDKNSAANISVEAFRHWNFPVHIHILRGPTKKPGITLAQATVLMRDVTTIWSQAGIGFTVVAKSISNTTDALVSVTTASGIFGFGESVQVTGKLNSKKEIDIYFVWKLWDGSSEGGDTAELTGFTIIPNPTGFDPGEAGVIIAVQGSDFSTVPSVKRRQIVRTIAHELAHYLLNEGDSAHADKPPNNNNLMRSGADDQKRDISQKQVRQTRESGVTPTSPDLN